METRTFTAKTVDEATGVALRALGAKLEDVDITVVNPGRSGILGLGGAPAVIEVKLLKRPDAPQPTPASISPRIIPAEQVERRERRERAPGDRRVAERPQIVAGPDAPAQPVAPGAETATSPEDERGDRRFDRRGRRGGRGQRQDRVEPRPAGIPGQDMPPSGRPAVEGRPPRRAATPELPLNEEVPAGPASEEEMAAEQDYPEAPPAERDAEAEQMVAQLLGYLLSSMGVQAETYVRDDLESGSIVFEIEGADSGLLIGRRGETLAAVQFLVRMITNRQLGRKCYVIIDVEGYRERRADMLRRLGRRTAGRVASSGRPASLEPMSPAERRIIHMALADHPRVRTESEGEGNHRRVVVLPRRGGPMGGDRGPRPDAPPIGDRPGFQDRGGDQGRGPRPDAPAGGQPGFQDRGPRRGFGNRRGGGGGWRGRRTADREQGSMLNGPAGEPGQQDRPSSEPNISDANPEDRS
ncbi:MAG: KH domain-containing protein [Dehalococcoidia bacterium]|nr:KH domain-containing protein [Dehalococcoidia bacterium]MSQ35203.1 KH domain-containing protein [Dehalococcoidia bacterium]